MKPKLSRLKTQSGVDQPDKPIPTALLAFLPEVGYAFLDAATAHPFKEEPMPEDLTTRLTRLLRENSAPKRALKDLLHFWLTAGLINVSDYTSAIELIDRIHE